VGVIITFFSFGLAMNMVGALTYMHSKYLSAKEKFETYVEEAEVPDEEDQNPEYET